MKKGERKKNKGKRKKGENRKPKKVKYDDTPQGILSVK